MDIIESKVKDWTLKEGQVYQTPEGIEVNSSHLKDICKFNAVPATLLGVDKKYNTSTIKEVLKVAAPKIQFITEGDNVQVLDPKSKFVGNEEFNQIIEIVRKSGYDGDIIENGFTTSFKVDVPQTDNDVFCGDVFKKSAKVTRLPQGGIQVQSDLLRLLCTNGMTVPDSQFRVFLRQGNFDGTVSNTFFNSLSNLSVKDYFDKLFIKNGVPVLASVSEYLGMKSTLRKITDSDEIADLLFPEDEIKNFYLNQNIDIETISSNNLKKLPSGLNYYQCFNILTNGAKSAEKTLENEMSVAYWCRPSYMKQLHQSNLVFEGMPSFSMMDIKERMGDMK